VSETERERAIGTLVLAFTADPFVRWIYPEAGQYLRARADWRDLRGFGVS